MLRRRDLVGQLARRLAGLHGDLTVDLTVWCERQDADWELAFWEAEVLRRLALADVPPADADSSDDEAREPVSPPMGPHRT